MYPPLIEHDHIRVILLQPAAARNDELVGSFQHISLNNHYYDLIDPYTALSYVWGEHTSADTILLDGQELGITANLGAALRDLRDGDRSHRVWADALCIDQRNIPERSQQVALMGQIYYRANNTVIYLGPLTSHAEIILREIHRAVLLGPNAENSPSDEEVIIKAANEGLLTQPWFHRVWVLQELVLSREPWVQFGPKRIRWQDLCHLLMPLLTQGQPAEDTTRKATVLETMNSVRTDYWKNHIFYRPSHPSPKEKANTEYRRDPRRLWNLLDMRKNCGVADLKDLIFAHLGIISDREEAFKYINIDYSQTTSELFIAVGRYINRRSGLGYLLDALGSSRTADLFLPSWVPDWNRQVPRGVSEPDLEKSLSNPFSASCRAEAFPIAAMAEIISVSNVIPPLPSSIKQDFYSKLENCDSEWQNRHFDVPRWKDVIDALAAMGVKSSGFDGIPFESWPDRLGSTTERVLFKPWLREFFLGGNTFESRLALLSNGIMIIVSRKASSGDLIVALEPHIEKEYGFPRRLYGSVSPSNTGVAVVQREIPPGAESWEQAYISNYVAAAMSQSHAYRASCFKEFSFLHGRLLELHPLSAPLNLRVSYWTKSEWAFNLVNGWSTHDVDGRLGKRYHHFPLHDNIAYVMVLH